MSILSFFKRGRRQAKENPKKQAEERRNEDPKPVYRHAPTHAAADALAGTPHTWRPEDRARILEESRRKSALAMGSVETTEPNSGMPRASSRLSTVMYLTDHANPMVATQRPQPSQGRQSHGMSTGAADSPPEQPFTLEAPRPRMSTLKGKDAARVASLVSSGTPPERARRGNGSAASSSLSITSQGISETKRPAHSASASGSTTSSPTTAVMGTAAATTPAEAIQAQKDDHSRSRSLTGTHRLYPGRQRRLSDASVEKALSGTPKQKQPSNPPRDSRPPPSTRGFSSIPPVPSLPALSSHISSSHAAQPHSNVASSNSSLASIESAASSPRAMSFNKRQTPNSSVSSTGSSDSYRAARPASIVPSAANEFVFPFGNDSTSDATVKRPSTATTVAPNPEARPRTETSPPVTLKPVLRGPEDRGHPGPDAESRRAVNSRPKNYYPPKVTRFAEPHEPGVVKDVGPPPPPRFVRPAGWPMRRFSQSSGLSFDEMVGPEPKPIITPEMEALQANGKRKLTKPKPSDLSKKSRWSIGMSRSAAATKV
ncbi:uncharacterized protein DNG_08673 [Cephalotrichum gorgonifer]|uniref:Uncharacterized protein n=1 Tax=Cephalotrichum gorgonifer TaxID=2041049 RepID=A0AAE8SYL1_9PEZI|nr:uncharacterized protein DNG_08673 [Cephalotrichum gorgonifer]